MRYTLRNEIKNVLVLLFIVITMLLIVGSVNAVDSNQEITAINDSLEINEESVISSDNEISKEIVTIDNDDGNEIEEQNSEIEVSQSDDKLGSADDSDVLSRAFFINVEVDTPVVKVGDYVVFDVYVQNNDQWNTYYGQWGFLPINNWFNESELEFINITPTAWAINYRNLTPSVMHYGDENSSYVRAEYDVSYGWQPWSDLHYKIYFKALKPGYHEFQAHIFDNWVESRDIEHVTVGNPELTIIKTPHQTEYCLGDDVYFDVYIENTGSLPLEDTCWWDIYDQYPPLIWIDDWYDPGLVFVDITFNPDKNGEIWTDNYDYADEYDGAYGHQLLIRYLTQGDWKPGYSLNFTTHFIANKTGQLNNSAHVFWKWKSWGDADVHEHIERWGNSSVRVGVPEFTVEKVALTKEVKVGDDVIFNVTVTNTGEINLTGVYIQDNEYTNGLEYFDYSDKANWTFDGTDKWTYNGKLAPGDSVSLLLTFTATSVGVKNNTAVCGNNLTNETLNSTDNVTVTENETENGTDDDVDVPEVPDETPEEDPQNPEEVPEETPRESEVQKETSSVAKTATGNPLFVLLFSLIALCFIPLRSKK